MAGRSFKEFLDNVNSRPENERRAAVDEFFGSIAAVPFVDDEMSVHFLFRGDAWSVTVPSDANEWNPTGFPMEHVAGTDLWYHTHRLEPNARLDYKFVINGEHWILDPLNPHQSEGGYGINSELRMPKYVPPQEVEFCPSIPHGTITSFSMYSENLGTTRDIHIYTPADYDLTTENYPLVIFHDGLDYLRLGCAKNVLDFLIARRKMSPVVAVFVPPVNRNAEYSGPQMGLFYAFIVDELLPFVECRYRTDRTPAGRATIGASNGGNMSLWLGLSYPEIFGNVAAQSSNIVSAVASAYEESPRLNLKLYVDIGTYDIPQLIPLVRSFVDLVRSKGYECVFRRINEGHSWGNWRAHVGQALRLFFPPKSLTITDRQRSRRRIKLNQDFVDTVTPSGTISFSVPEKGHVTLKVFDSAGKEQCTLVDDVLPVGEQNVHLNLGDLPSGSYYYILSGDTFNLGRKFTLVR